MVQIVARTEIMTIYANELFEEYLKNNTLPHQNVDGIKGLAGKRPDFFLEKDGVTVFVEVKEIMREKWEESQWLLQKKLNQSFSSLKLGYGFSSFADEPSGKEISFFANFLKRLEGADLLSAGFPLCLVMPKHEECIMGEGKIVSVYLLDKNKEIKGVVISPETKSSKYPIPLSYMNMHRTYYAEINGELREYYEVCSGKPVIVLKKISLDNFGILPITLMGWGGKSDQIKGKINKAADNLGPYKDRGPCVLVLYTQSCAGIMRHDLLNAIGGTEQFTFPISRNGEELNEENITMIRAKDGQLSPWKNARFSAISILKHSPDGPCLETYHNPFARQPLAKDYLYADNDKAFYFDDTGQIQEYAGNAARAVSR